MEFNTDTQLFNAIFSDTKLMIDKLGKEYLKSMQDSIDNIVYDPYKPNKYKRQYNNGGFYGSWQSDVSDSGLHIENRIWSNPDAMNLDRANYVHGSLGYNPSMPVYDMLFGGAVDRRPRMAQIIAEGTDYDFYVDEYDERGNNWWTRERDYFSPVVDEIDSNIDIDVERLFSKQNIKVI